MKWQDTVSSKCRWNEYTEEMFYNWDIVWEASVNDYQGSVEFLALKDGKFAYMVYNYGSCSGCDSWEGEPEEQIRRDFANMVELFDDHLDLSAWANQTNHTGILEYLKEHKDKFDKQFIHDFENTH